jgi:hypothetical protein
VACSILYFVVNAFGANWTFMVPCGIIAIGMTILITCVAIQSEWKESKWKVKKLAELAQSKPTPQAISIEPNMFTIEEQAEIKKFCAEWGDEQKAARIGTTPLHVVAFGQISIAVIKYLILQGANVNEKNALGFTPLDLAVQRGNTGGGAAIIQYLESVGATGTRTTDTSHPAFFCTNCGNSVSQWAGVCPSCGATPTNHKKFCRHCGVALNPEQVVCVKCNTSIENNTDKLGQRAIFSLLVGLAIGVFGFMSTSGIWKLLAIVIMVIAIADFLLALVKLSRK